MKVKCVKIVKGRLSTWALGEDGCSYRWNCDKKYWARAWLDSKYLRINTGCIGKFVIEVAE